jgi:hypothetical protein
VTQPVNPYPQTPASLPAPLTIEAFTTGFPEFRNAEKGLVYAKLSEAYQQIDLSVWDTGANGPKSGIGQGYLAAHLLALSPFGQNARMIAKNGTTTYLTHYRNLQRQVCQGFRVAGGSCGGAYSDSGAWLGEGPFQTLIP